MGTGIRRLLGVVFLSILATGCGKQNLGTDIDPELQPYVNQFMAITAEYGLSVSLDGLVVRMGDLGGVSGTFIATCKKMEDGMKVITIDNAKREAQRKQLLLSEPDDAKRIEAERAYLAYAIHHEAGHCLTDWGHIEGTIMARNRIPVNTQEKVSDLTRSLLDSL